MSYVINKPEQDGVIRFLSELPNLNTGKEHPMPFMDPCLRMCLGVRLLAGGSGIIQLCPRSFSGMNVVLLLFEKV